MFDEFKFGRSSRRRLDTVHPLLQRVMEEAIKSSPWDFGISSGIRTAAEQYALYIKGASQRDGKKLKSKHQLGDAVDVIVYVKGKYVRGVNDQEELPYYALIGHIMGTAKRLGIKLRSGSDWDRDGDFSNNNFSDLGHFEIILD